MMHGNSLPLFNSYQVPNFMTVSTHRLQNINCIIQPSSTLGGLYLGDVVSTLKPDLINNYDIKAICENVAGPSSLNVPHHRRLPIRDTYQEQISNYFEDSAEWIHNKRQQKINVLVHCHAGVSRSSAIVCAYFIKTQNYSPAQALEHVRSRRPRAKPNDSFWRQLNQFYSKGDRKQETASKLQNSFFDKSELDSKILNQSAIHRQNQVAPKPTQTKSASKESNIYIQHKTETKSASKVYHQASPQQKSNQKSYAAYSIAQDRSKSSNPIYYSQIQPNYSAYTINNIPKDHPNPNNIQSQYSQLQPRNSYDHPNDQLRANKKKNKFSLARKKLVETRDQLVSMHSMQLQPKPFFTPQNQRREPYQYINTTPFNVAYYPQNTGSRQYTPMHQSALYQPK